MRRTWAASPAPGAAVGSLALEGIASVWTANVWYGGLAGHHALGRRRAIGFAIVLFFLFNGI